MPFHMLQHTATRCNTLQHAATNTVTYCNTLEHTHIHTYTQTRTSTQRDTLSEVTVTLRTVVTFVTWLISRTEFLI